MSNGTELAERKQKITAAQALQMVQQWAKAAHREQQSNYSRSIAEANRLAGGQTERVDKEVIEQGRAWAMRLAIIARRTAGGSGREGYYQPSKANAALTPLIKKLFGIVGELEAIQATDVELSLFTPPKSKEYFGFGDDLKKMSPEKFVQSLTEGSDPGDSVSQDEIIEAIGDIAGEKVVDEFDALFEGYEIEPIVVPEDPQDEGADKSKSRRRGRR